MKPIVSAFTVLLIIRILFPVSLFAGDGSGTAVITNQQPIIAGSSGNTIMIVFTAAETMDGGQIRVSLPPDGSTPWSPMQQTPNTPGSVTVTSNGVIERKEVDLTGVTVYIERLAPAGTITVVYSDAQASSKVGEHTFKVESALKGGKLTDIASPPRVSVIAAGSGQMEIDPPSAAGGSSRDAVFKLHYTAVGTPAENPNILNGGEVSFRIPAEWPPPKKAKTAAGYVQIVATSVALGTLAIDPKPDGDGLWWVRVPVNQMSGGGGFTVQYEALDVPPLPDFQIRTDTFITTVNGRELLTSPQVLISGHLPGPGEATVSPTAVIAGSSEVQLTFVYTATQAIQGGQIALTVPEEWKVVPQPIPKVPGYTTVTIDANKPYSVAGNPIIIPIPSLDVGKTVTIQYGAGGGLAGAQAQRDLGSAEFIMESAIRPTSALLPLDKPFSPLVVQVTPAADGSGVVTVEPTRVPSGGSVSLTFRYQPQGTMDGGQLRLTVPEGWSTPQGNSGGAGATEARDDAGNRIAGLGFSGRTVSIPIIRLTSEQTLTVIYSRASTQPKMGRATFQVESQGSANSSLKALSLQPTVEVTTAPDGSGEAKISPEHLFSGSHENIIQMTYTASGTLVGGELRVETPPGWSLPQGVKGVEGYTTVISDGTIRTPIFAGRTITIPIDFLEGNQEITITYGAEGGDSGVTVPASAGEALFVLQSKGGAGGSLKELTEVSPDQLKIEVSSADGSGTMTVEPPTVAAGRLEPEVVFTYTPEFELNDGTLRLEIPNDWTPPKIGVPGDAGHVIATTPSGGGIRAPEVFGNFIIVPITRLAPGQTVRIQYQNVTPPPLPQEVSSQKVDFPVQLRATAKGRLTNLREFPRLEVISVDGSGRIDEWSPRAIAAESLGNQLTFVFKAEFQMDGGSISMAWPSDWPSPQPPVVTTTGIIGESIFENDLLIVPIIELGKDKNHHTIEIVYSEVEAPRWVETTQLVFFTFEVQSKASPTGTLKPLTAGSPTIAIHAPNGSGTAEISPKAVPVNTEGLEIKITFTAIGVMDGGAIRIDVPDDEWSSPQGTTGIPGYTTSSSPDGHVLPPRFPPGRSIVVNIIELRSGQIIEVRYGFGGGDSGVVVPETPVDAEFTVHSASTASDASKLVNREQSFRIEKPPILTVMVKNNPPAFDPIPNPEVREDSGQTDVRITGVVPGPANESSQTVSLTAVSSNPTLIPSPTLSGTGATRTLSFTPVVDAFGSVTITVTAKDDGGTTNGGVETFRREFTITVTPVNDPPSFDPIPNQTVLEDSRTTTVPIAGVSPGPATEASQTVSLTAISSNPTLIPSPTLSGTGTTRTLSFTPVVDAFGSVTITVTAKDDGGTTNGGVETFQREFTITVTPVNDPPSFDPIPNQTVLEDSGTTTVPIAGVVPGPANESSQTVSLTAVSSNPTLIPSPTLSGTGATRTLSFTPVVDAFGSVTITVTAKDDGGTTNGGVETFRREFTITVTPVNDPPAFDPLPNPEVREDSGQTDVRITGVVPGPANESSQTVSLTAVSSNPTLIPSPTLSGTGATRTLSFTPVTDAFGPVTITVTAKDDGGTTNGGVDTFQRKFTITVNPPPPTAVVSIDPPKMESPSVGKQFTVDVKIAEGANVAGYQITVTFNPTALKYIRIANADYLPAGASAAPPVVGAGKVTLAATSATGPAAGTDGTLAKATFEVVALKASTIGLADVALSDATGKSLPLTTRDGTVTNPLEKIVRLKISPTPAWLTVGGTLQFNVSAFDAGNFSVPITETDVTWKVDGGIGSITEAGEFTAERARNGTLTATLKSKPNIHVTIPLSINTPPRPRDDAKIPTTITIGGEPLHLAVTDFFVDADGDTLRWHLENRDAIKNWVDVAVTDSSATIRANKPEAVSPVLLKFLVSDGKIADSERFPFPLSLTLNHLPRLAGEAALRVMFKEGEVSPSYALRDNITDPDGDFILFTLSVPETVPFQRSADSTEEILRFEGKNGNSFGTGIVQIQADDQKGGVTHFELQVTIEEVNDPPHILRGGDEIPQGKAVFPSQVTVSQGGEQAFDLSLYVVDPDNTDESPTNDDTLTWTADLSPPTDGVMIERVEESRFTIRASGTATGTFNLRLTVNDGRNGRDFSVMVVTIQAVLTLPDQLPNPTNGVPLPPDFPTVLLEDHPFKLNLAAYVTVTSPSDRIRSWSAASNDLLEIEITLEGSATFTPKPYRHGKTTVTLTAVNSVGAAIPGDITLLITPVPNPPILKLPPKVTFTEDDSENPTDDPPWRVEIVPLAEANQPVSDEGKIGVFDDEQRPDELSWKVEGSSHLTAEVKGLALIITPKDLDWHGTETLTIRVTDGEAQWTEEKLTVTVTPVPEPPRIIKSFESIEFVEDTLFTLDLAGHATDDEPVDSPKGKITWSADNTAHLTITIAGAEATITPATHWHGEEEMTLTATDGEGLSVTTPLRVLVKALPLPHLSEGQIIASGPLANHTIRFRLRDDESGPCRVWAFYRMGDSPKRVPCVVANQTPDGWLLVDAPAEEKRSGVIVDLIWFAGIETLANATDTVSIEIEAYDNARKSGMLVIDHPYRIDNRGKVSPELREGEPTRSESDSGNQSVEVPLVLTQPVPSDTPWQIQVMFRPQSNPGASWQPASVRRGEAIRKGIIDGFPTLSGFFHWLSAFDVSTSGLYQLRWTPVIGTVPVGPTLTTTHKVGAPRGVQILPPSRIITPAHPGYNDTLEVLFPATGGAARSQFAIYDLGGFLVYPAAKNSHETLSNGWLRYTWNGRADNHSSGEIAEDGIYIYLLIVDGKVTKGTFALAK